MFKRRVSERIKEKEKKNEKIDDNKKSENATDTDFFHTTSEPTIEKRDSVQVF